MATRVNLEQLATTDIWSVRERGVDRKDDDSDEEGKKAIDEWRGGSWKGDMLLIDGLIDSGNDDSEEDDSEGGGSYGSKRRKGFVGKGGLVHALPPRTVVIPELRTGLRRSKPFRNKPLEMHGGNGVKSGPNGYLTKTTLGFLHDPQDSQTHSIISARA